MDSDALRAKLLRFLQEQLGADAEALESNTELVSSGLVDSASLVQLATFVERQTDLEIPDRDIGADHFDTVAAILRYVDARRHA